MWTTSLTAPKRYHDITAEATNPTLNLVKHACARVRLQKYNQQL